MTPSRLDERHPRTGLSYGSAARTPGWERAATGWAGSALRGLEFVAYPAIAGAAFCLLALGVVTWLPALAALASALHRWRRDGDTRCFTGVFAAFPRCWRALWRHALLATAVPPAVLVAVVFLAGRPEPIAIPLLAAQIGGLAAFAVYHLALAVVAGSDAAGASDVDAAARPAWRARALVFAFGSPRRGLVLLAALLLAPVLGLPLVLGPLLFGPSLPVLCGLVLLDRGAAPGR